MWPDSLAKNYHIEVIVAQVAKVEPFQKLPKILLKFVKIIANEVAQILKIAQSGHTAPLHCTTYVTVLC